MNVLIVEDEELLALELAEKLVLLNNDIKIVGQTHSVASTVEWLQHNDCDLIFMDIHLSDGNSFSIFDKIKVTHPVIFTTAYDQYAIRAFDVNSIGYLLKPIEEQDLENVLTKYREMKDAFQSSLENLLNHLKEAPPTQKKFLDRIILFTTQKQISIPVNEIAYFMADDRYLFAITDTGNKYFYNSTLYKLEEELDNQSFFRLNRRFIANLKSIVSFTPYSKGRVKVKLNPALEDEVIISSDKVKDFKLWLTR